MKKRQFSKKLQLNKTTIANINESQMNDVKGGYIVSKEIVCDPLTKIKCFTVVGCTDDMHACIPDTITYKCK